MIICRFVGVLWGICRHLKETCKCEHVCKETRSSRHGFPSFECQVYFRNPCEGDRDAGFALRAEPARASCVFRLVGFCAPVALWDWLTAGGGGPCAAASASNCRNPRTLGVYVKVIRHVVHAESCRQTAEEPSSCKFWFKSWIFTKAKPRKNENNEPLWHFWACLCGEARGGCAARALPILRIYIYFINI